MPPIALPPFEYHRVRRAEGSLSVRDFPGRGPAFVLLHGFPDNSRIYDPVIPHLVAGGRRVVTLDFLGFGASDKPEGTLYSFAQQLADVAAVADALKLETLVAVGHDAGGPAAVNFALNQPERTAAVVLMNAFYGEAPGLRVPELIEIFSTPTLADLQRHFLRSPAEFGWLVDFQRVQMQRNLSAEQKARYESFLGPLVNDNFTQHPSAAPAFAAMTSQFQGEIAANTARLVAFRRTAVPLLLIWGGLDPYLHVSVAEALRSEARTAALHVLQAGHWPQIDEAAEVARIMLEHH
jgi:haloalkane dehalogenase